MNNMITDRTISTLNVDLLLQIADRIAKRPEAFDMGHWDCGTTACIAGWALRLSGKQWGLAQDGHMYSAADAAQCLGLDESIADRLFLRTHWPDDFNNARYKADKAGTTIARIHHFIRTGL